MSNWKTTVRIGDLHGAHEAGEITIQEVATALAKRFKANRYAKGGPDLSFGLLDVIDGLEEMGSDPECTVEDYDEWLAELYSFGDRDHRIWVDSSRKAA